MSSIEDDAATDRQIIDTVRTYAGDIDETASRVKLLKEQQAEVLENMPAYEDYIRAKEDLERAAEHLKSSLLQNGKYNDLAEKLADEKVVLKDQRGILSSYLLEHYRLTGERQIEMSEHDAREIKFTGKLGKEVKYQTNLFAGDNHAS